MAKLSFRLSTNSWAVACLFCLVGGLFCQARPFQEQKLPADHGDPQALRSLLDITFDPTIEFDPTVTGPTINYAQGGNGGNGGFAINFGPATGGNGGSGEASARWLMQQEGEALAGNVLLAYSSQADSYVCSQAGRQGQVGTVRLNPCAQGT